MKCARCKATVESGARFCAYCGTKSAAEPRLAWDDPALAVASDPPLRRKYRLLQSWYREHVLDADYGYSFLKSPRPVGSLLAPEEVGEAPELNFLCDRAFLRYADERVPQVQAAHGTLEEHRLRHNLVIDVFAEWTPERPQSELLNDRTAFDAAILYRRPDGVTGLIGIETKYTEPLSQREYHSERYVEVTERCGWFRAGAHTSLVASATNQLWRNAMLAAAAMGLTVEDAHLAVVGLDEDASLWDAADSVAAHMGQPQRLLLTPWSKVTETAMDTPLELFAQRFNERYLDTRPLTDRQVPVRVRRRPRINRVDLRWSFVGASLKPQNSHGCPRRRPGTATIGPRGSPPSGGR